MRYGQFLAGLLVVLVAGAGGGADDKKEEAKKDVRGVGKVTTVGDEVKAIEAGGRVYNERVKVFVWSGKGKVYADADVWACRREVKVARTQQPGLEIALLGKYDGATHPNKVLQFDGQTFIGEGAVIEDAAGNVYQVGKAQGALNFEVELVKAAKKEKK
jgi:hypothetical protein